MTIGFKDLQVGTTLLALVKVKKIEGAGGSASVITVQLGEKDVRVEFCRLHLYDMRRLDNGAWAEEATKPADDTGLVADLRGPVMGGDTDPKSASDANQQSVGDASISAPFDGVVGDF